MTALARGMKRLCAMVVVQTRIEYLAPVGTIDTINCVDVAGHIAVWISAEMPRDPLIARPHHHQLPLYLARAELARVLFADWRDPERERLAFRQRARVVAHVVRLARQAEHVWLFERRQQLTQPSDAAPAA